MSNLGNSGLPSWLFINKDNIDQYWCSGELWEMVAQGGLQLRDRLGWVVNTYRHIDNTLWRHRELKTRSYAVHTFMYSVNCVHCTQYWCHFVCNVSFSFVLDCNTKYVDVSIFLRVNIFCNKHIFHLVPLSIPICYLYI